MGARFSAPVQNVPGDHPASYTMGTESFSGVKRPRRGVDHPPPSNAEVKERAVLKPYFPSLAFVACSRLIFTLIIRVHKSPCKARKCVIPVVCVKLGEVM